MTSISSIQGWAIHPIGKVVRVAMAVGGAILATLVLTTAATVDSGSWVLVLLGVGLAAISVRAARVPNVPRLVLLTIAVIAAPVALQFL